MNYAHPHAHHSPAGLNKPSANTARFHENISGKGYYDWSRRRLPDPGVQNYSFNNHRVSETPYVGNAVSHSLQFRSVQPPQVYFPNQGVFMTGLGGIVSEQIYGQPLMDAAQIAGALNG